VSHNPIIYLRDNGCNRYSLIAEKGHSIFDFRESSREKAMLVAINYCSSWNSITVKWYEEKDQHEQKTKTD
jgi:hypothetical protein